MNDKSAYIGRKPCGCVMGVVTDLGNRFTAETVASFIKDGLVVNHISWDKYREVAREPTFMECSHGQLPLALEGVDIPPALEEIAAEEKA